MTSHELAKQLLELPDQFVVVPAFNVHNHWELVIRVECSEVQEGLRTPERTHTIFIGGLSAPEMKDI